MPRGPGIESSLLGRARRSVLIRSVATRCSRVRLELVADDVLDIIGGLRFGAGRAAAAELDGELDEELLEALRIAHLRRLCDLDGVLELVGEERNETAL